MSCTRQLSNNEYGRSICSCRRHVGQVRLADWKDKLVRINNREWTDARPRRISGIPPEQHARSPAEGGPCVMQKRRRKSFFAALMLTFALPLLVIGCSSLSPEQRDAVQRDLDRTGEAVLVRLVEKQPEAREAIEHCLGYAVADMSLAKVPFVGAASGYAIVVDKRTGDRTYVKVSQFEVGGGWGAQTYKAVILFDDEVLLKKAMTGFWHFEAGAEAAARDSSIGVRPATGRGYRAYKITEEGAVATLTVKVIRGKPL